MLTDNYKKEINSMDNYENFYNKDLFRPRNNKNIIGRNIENIIKKIYFK